MLPLEAILDGILGHDVLTAQLILAQPDDPKFPASETQPLYALPRPHPGSITRLLAYRPWGPFRREGGPCMTR